MLNILNNLKSFLDLTSHINDSTLLSSTPFYNPKLLMFGISHNFTEIKKLTKVLIVSQDHGRFLCAVISYALLMFVVCCSLLIMCCSCLLKCCSRLSVCCLCFTIALLTAHDESLILSHTVAHISLSVARGCYMLFTAPDYVLFTFDIILLATQGLLIFSVLLMVEYMLFNFNASFTCNLLVIHAIMALTFKQ